MATSDIDVCSMALMSLGAKPLNSLDDPGDTAKFLKLAYPRIRAGVISSYAWECMKVREKLTRLTERPSGFDYAFIMPGKLIGAPAAVYDSGAVGARATSAFEVRGRTIVARFPECWVELSIVKQESEWPAWFFNLMVAAVCAEIAFMVTDQQSTQDYWEVKTYGTPSENRMGGLYGQATTLDAQGSGNNPGLYDNAFIDARFGGVYPGDMA